MIEIDIKSEMPTVSEALHNLEFQLGLNTGTKNKVVVIIHGYGSSGIGGAICKAARKWLNAQLAKGVLRAVVEGENFNVFNENARKIRTLDKDVETYYRCCNHGVTIVWLK